MHKGFLLTGSALGALAVILGAFGAHGLKQIVSPETVNVFDTGVRYQFYHVFALILLGILFERFPVPLLYWAGICFIIGIILFSGSLYLITLMKARDTVGLKGIGILTPVGGLFFVAGWVLLFVGLLKKGI
ncbi:MAG: DUF423 domain-containing protein [Chitinophagaceae bacterium]|nr:MAG: DUF423 domain-containing protein [Chitinophagaceae bacterium]